MTWVSGILIGAAISAPLWVLLTRWWLRSTIDRTRRMAAAARQQGHLVELGTLTGGLAHELKNPLSTIKVNLQLLIEDLDEPAATEPQKRWLRRLRTLADEVTRLQQTLDDFLRFAGKHELQLKNVDFRQVIADLADFFTPQAEAAHVRVRTSGGDDSLYVQIDVDLMKQALLNLMINAQQAMPEGGELILKTTRLRRRMQLEVIDTGTGMPPEVVSKIFTAYYTTKRGGTGLGLPTALRIIREHGGQISVDSTAGTGTRFVISLPLAEKPRATKD